MFGFVGLVGVGIRSCDHFEYQRKSFLFQNESLTMRILNSKLCNSFTVFRVLSAEFLIHPFLKTLDWIELQKRLNFPQNVL